MISSDAIAFYELIKNAFDAGSPRAEINVVSCVPHNSVAPMREVLSEIATLSEDGEISAENVRSIRDLIKSELQPLAPNFSLLKESLDKADSIEEFNRILDESNYIEIKDTGEGMSKTDLSDIYLTIGTRSRLIQREMREQSDMGSTADKSKRPILGEKGLGRLSTMRLGERLKVTTSKSGETNWNVLEIDWRMFSHASDKLIGEIEVEPRTGEKKDSPEKSGTTIYVSALEADWSLAKLEQIARDEFSRLTDPFVPTSRYPITLRFNGNVVPIISFDKFLFENAHAVVNAEYLLDDESSPKLVGSVNYKFRQRQKTFELDGLHLFSTTGSNPLILQRLGVFKVELYWFNRRLFNRTEGGPEYKRLKDLVKQWAGGLMVYRDGFRVNPYGSPEDDWLNLDKTALAAPGYKVNRRQIIGKVDISARDNPYLVDQTNREGLRDNDEKHALVKLLQYVLLDQLRAFLDASDAEVQAREPLSFEDFEARVQTQEKQLQFYVQSLIEHYPAIAEEKQLLGGLRNSTDGIRALIIEANQLAEEYEKGHTQLVNLAGLGLMVEIIGHELSRATTHALSLLETIKPKAMPDTIEGVFNPLREQLKTLERRLRILDPLNTSGRQFKDTFELVAWVEEILKSHDEQFKRHDIILEFSVEPNDSKSALTVKAVKGMIVQILENLISNSVYWIKQKRRIEPQFKPIISVIIDIKSKEIRLTDNGPGISHERQEEVFQPFVTTKPPGQGKGLGLYISREIAGYNNAVLYLSEKKTIYPNRLNTFVLALETNNR